ncbi:phosphogluconate dehydrogenase (NAD(+)-dependent, decarboxylating) [Aridibaculum aurantiacum]|uniref:phosphogluconate dehydrogenase (NAD(+)-dependent, decarboxylating) n=1 Tax=Aridibaculum aurantiacum TaxID=2810307 RepID=UPI001A97647A|nr:decarboxylating 6-phosphogluconate dehydrogenase [Aridibaculum aurantiacum]
MKGTIGIIGLGKMGSNLAFQAVDKGYEVVGYDLFVKPGLFQDKIIQAADMEEFIGRLSLPRVVLIFIPAGKPIDDLIDNIVPMLSPGDVLADCGNSYWGDTIRRAQRISESGVYFIDSGTSGGVDGARNGACFMIGGDKKGVEIIEPILKDLAVEGGYVHAGNSGAGHYVKLVHNGIEFGMLQAIGEGMNLLARYREPLDYTSILKCWENGSVIRSWLIELMRQQLEKQDGYDNIPAYIEDTGEVNWLVTDAMHMEVPIPVIAQSVMSLIASRDKEQTWAKAVAMMRHGFGGHPFGESAFLKYERMYSQVEGFPKPQDEQGT